MPLTIVACQVSGVGQLQTYMHGCMQPWQFQVQHHRGAVYYQKKQSAGEKASLL